MTATAGTVPAMASSEDRTFHPHVEGARGVAAFYVVIFHIWQLAVQNASTGTLAGWYGGTWYLQYGHFAVVVFIVISGFCLGLPVAARPDRPFRVLEFFKRRARRLMPAYVAVVLLSIVPWCLTAIVAHQRINPPNIAIATVLHLALIHNLFYATTEYLNGPLWSIALESQIYVVFALVLIPVWRASARFGLAAQLAVALVLGLVPHFVLHTLDWTWPWLLGLFGMGVVAAALTVRTTLPRLPWRALSLVAGVVALFFVVGTRDGVPDGSLWPTDFVLGAAVALFFVVSARFGGRGLKPLLASPPILLLGTFSYSLYLIHAPIVDLTAALLKRANAGTAVSMLVWAVLIPALLVAAYGFYRVFERPFLSNAFRAVRDAEVDAAEHPDRGVVSPAA